MLIIPAIDIKDGKCVRLLQGHFSRQTVYSDFPEEVARSFQDSGAKRLHLVDLDGAKTGVTKNYAIIEKIVSALQIPIQLGGGIRSFEQIMNWLSSGISSVVVGTLALKQPAVVELSLAKFGPEKIILAVDVRDDLVTSEGWQQNSKMTAIEFVKNFENAGLGRIIYTDISRDGTLAGPNLQAIKEIALETGLKITASGGIASKHHLQQLQKLEPFGVDSVIVGRAFYEGRILPEEVF
jgi:phosphoribosylformimino-5-aminoimidazole carboxamide ribotide isomerase